jgi:hypothetical protein
MRVRNSVLAAASVLALSVPVLGTVGASAAPTISDNSNSNACFGQARAWYASQGINGEVISTRKGDNPTYNDAYIAANC